MHVSFQNTNVHSGNESTVLRFRMDDGTTACVLIDAGNGVDIDELLDDDEYLNAILLTHGHIDHYRTLGENVRHNAPIYTSPATASIVELALPEAQKNNDIHAVSTALDALEPINDWTSILPSLDVRPIPVGHTPGAVGFLFRFHDDTRDAAEFEDGAQYLLATGDFTTRSCAGYSGLETTLPIDIDAVLLNAATNEEYTTALNESIHTILEHGFAGSRVVVATSALTGVHYATLLGALTDELDRTLPIRLVGQAAKVWDALEFEASSVESHAVFSDVTEVLDSGTVTICGPEDPTLGSANRLLTAIADDPAAVFVQLTTGGTDAVSGVSCTSHSFELINHPTTDTLDETVRRLAPKHVVLKHATGNDLKRLQKRYNKSFMWGATDTREHTLYDDGVWVAPEWLSETAVQKIRMKQWQAVNEKPISRQSSLPPLGRTTVDLGAEGITVDDLVEQFSPQPILAGHDAQSPKVVRSAEAQLQAKASGATRKETETTLVTDNSVEESFESTVLARLDAIESKLEHETETVQARVLSGDGETFLQVLDDVDFAPGQVVELQIHRSTAEDDATE